MNVKPRNDCNALNTGGDTWNDPSQRLGHHPAGIWCRNDVVSTSMRRNHVASTLIRRHFRTKCPLGNYLRKFGPHRSAYTQDKNMDDLQVYVFLTIFESYRDYGRVIMKIVCSFGIITWRNLCNTQVPAVFLWLLDIYL